MQNLIIKFTNKADFSAFIKSASYYNNKSMQNNILINVISNVYKKTKKLTKNSKPVCVKKNKYFVNVRIINDAKKSSIFNKYAVVVKHQLRS